jgi:hypothetical protein
LSRIFRHSVVTQNPPRDGIRHRLRRGDQSAERVQISVLRSRDEVAELFHPFVHRRIYFKDTVTAET